jgi:hypothetical protein
MAAIAGEDFADGLARRLAVVGIQDGLRINLTI